MPLYEYVCKKCEESFAVLQSLNSSENNTKCPKCGSGNVKKKISSFSYYSSVCNIHSPFSSSKGFGGG